MEFSKTGLSRNLWIVLALMAMALVGIWPAIYNGFPLVNSDSGANIMLSFVGYVPKDRSLFYTYFVRASNLGVSLYGTVYVQSLIGVSLLYWWMHSLWPIKQSLKITFVVLLVLSFCTPYAWYVSQINSDIFMGFYFVAMLLLLFRQPSKWQKLALVLLVMMATSFHNSILLISLFLGLCFALISIHKKYRMFWGKAKLTLGLSILVLIPTCLANFIAFRTFAPNPSSHIFIMSRLAEMGILEDVLKQECTSNNYQLCNTFVDFNGRQWDFMWVDHYPHGADKWLDSTVKTEYNALIRATFTHPSYLSTYIVTNVKDAFVLLPETKMDDGLQQFLEGSSPWNNINGFMHAQISSFSKAKQQLKSINFELFNSFIKYSFWSCVLLLFFTLVYYLPKYKMQYFKWVLAALLFCIVNNILTSCLSTNLERFNARIIWIIPLAIFLQICDNRFHKRSATKG